jgi:long-chain acyl-CoA synthetase
MQEHTGPSHVEVSQKENLTTSLWRLLQERPDRPALAHREGEHFETWSTRRFVEEVRAVARGLMGLGIEPGQRVCIYSATRIEWTVLDYAIWAAGAVTVPIYETSSSEQVEWIVANSKAVAMALESEAMLAKYESVAERLPACKQVFVLNDGGLETIKAAGRDISEEALQARAEAVTGEDTASIVYTSGTTGRPKGCVLTHHNMVFTAAATQVHLPQLLGPGKSTLLFLPLAHVYSRLIAVVCIRSGVLLAFCTGIPRLQEELRMIKPSFLFAVPRVFEKILAGAQRKAQDAGRGRIFDKAMELAERSSRERAAGAMRLRTRLQHAVFNALVYRKLRAAMGGKVDYAVSGGAPLGERLGHLFEGIGITLLEGYGLTETTAPTAGNGPGAVRHGTVGHPYPDVTVRIADDGEILIRGPNVFRGYLDDPEATAEVFDDDGWFCTGDLGRFDDDGFLRITGRKKEIIVTAGGKNIAPAALEERIRAHPLVSQSVVVGEGQPFIGALIALDPEAVSRWGKEHGKQAGALAELSKDAELHHELESAIKAANRSVSRAEQIREFRVVPDELSIETGALTPTMKVKRSLVEARYRHLIDDIYAQRPAEARPSAP